MASPSCPAGQQRSLFQLYLLCEELKIFYCNLPSVLGAFIRGQADTRSDLCGKTGQFVIANWLLFWLATEQALLNQVCVLFIKPLKFGFYGQLWERRCRSHKHAARAIVQMDIAGLPQIFSRIMASIWNAWLHWSGAGIRQGCSINVMEQVTISSH